MATLRLNLVKDLSRHLRSGHPWVFRDALAPIPKLPAGAIVDVVDRGRFVARGYYDPSSAIAVRILTREVGETIDGAFFRRRVAAAVALRERFLQNEEAKTNAYRLLHGEGDGLPGVIVDLYGGVAVLKLYSEGLAPHRAALVEALKANLPSLTSVLGRDEVREGDADTARRAPGKVLWGAPVEELLTIEEHGVRLLVDCLRGQKTGLFLDQRENRRLVRELSRGRSVLNCFSYTGGFSVNAALGGAERVMSVDLDADAIALCRRNFKENGLAAERHDFLAADVHEVLHSFAAREKQFDLIILDPPAYAKSQRAVEAALDGYASLNRAAMKLLAPGGILCTASCTARVSPDAFLSTVKEAAAKDGLIFQVLHERFQPPDHPVLLQFPEGRYLKFYVLARLA